MAAGIIAGTLASFHDLLRTHTVRATCSIKGTYVCNDHFWVAVAQRSDRVADLFNTQTVTHRATLLHIDGLELNAIGGLYMAILAIKRLTKTKLLAHSPCHTRDTIRLRQMHIVREFQSAIFHWLLIERYPLPFRWRAVRRDHLWLELGMRSAEITRIGNLGVGQPLVHIGMAAAAKLLLGFFHRSGAFMLGMAFNAAPLGPAKTLGDFT